MTKTNATKEQVKNYKKIIIAMPKQLHKQIVSKQYDIFKRENRRVSVASLIRDGLEFVYGNERRI